MKESQKTYNHAAIYGIGTIIRHMVSIIMLPIYTRFLTPEDYGMAELLSMGVDFIGLIIGVVGSDALIRFYYEKSDEDYRRQVVSSAALVAISMNLIAFLFIVATASYYSSYLFDGTYVENGAQLVIMYAATLVFQVMSGITGAYLRARQQPKLFVFFSVLRLIMAVLANLYFVVYKELHIVGVVYAVFTFTLLDGFIQISYMLSKTGVHFSPHTAKKMISFSFPLLLSSLALFLATYSDRVIIKEFIGLAELGLYALAYKFAYMLYSIAWTPLQQSWDVRRYEVVNLPDATKIFQATFRQTQLFVIFIALCFITLSKDILRIMADPAFHEAYLLVTILVPAYVIKIWSNFCFFGVFYAKKTKYKAYIEWSSGIVTASLFFLLIPMYSIYGAATATFLGFLFRFLLINHFSTKLYDMKLEWSFIGKLVLIATLISIMSLTIELDILLSVLLNMLLLLVFLLATYFLPVLHSEDKRVITALLKFPLKFL